MIRERGIGRRLICSGRSARRTRYRCRYDYSRTYAGDPLDEDPAVCLECPKPADRCRGEYHCYLHQKRIREKANQKRAGTDWLIDQWKPSGIYDIWGESL